MRRLRACIPFPCGGKGKGDEQHRSETGSGGRGGKSRRYLSNPANPAAARVSSSAVLQLSYPALFFIWSLVRGQTAKQCKSGCVKCGLCVKACPRQCLSLKDGLPEADMSLCTSCGLCAARCPVKVLALLRDKRDWGTGIVENRKEKGDGEERKRGNRKRRPVSSGMGSGDGERAGRRATAGSRLTDLAGFCRLALIP